MKTAKSKEKRTVRKTNVIDFVPPDREPTPAESEPHRFYSWDLRICQIAITLKHTDPPIWRHILVHQDSSALVQTTRELASEAFILPQ